jgi:hypothetical protein
MNDIVVKNTQSITQNVVDDLGAVSDALMTLAKDKDFDVDKMKAIMDLRISMIDRQAKQEFNQDFFALKNEIPVILQLGKIMMFDKDNKSSKVVSTYARLEDIQNALEPLLKKHNFILRHGNMDFRDGKYFIPTTLLHISGHEETVCFVSPPDKANGLKGDMQAVKSTAMFGRRVNIINLFDLKEASDEKSEMYKNQKITIEQAEEIESLIISSGTNREQLLKFCGVDNVLDIPLNKYKKSVQTMQDKIGVKL